MSTEPSTPYWQIILWLFVMGMGCTMMPTMTAALQTLTDHNLARGSTLMNIVQQVAASIGTALFSVLLTNGFKSSPEVGQLQQAATTPEGPASLDPAVIGKAIAGSRMTADGVLVIDSRAFRTQGETSFRPAAIAYTELQPKELPMDLLAEAYLQGGYVGGKLVEGAGLRLDDEVSDDAAGDTGQAVGLPEDADRLDEVGADQPRRHPFRRAEKDRRRVARAQHGHDADDGPDDGAADDGAAELDAVKARHLQAGAGEQRPQPAVRIGGSVAEPVPGGVDPFGRAHIPVNG